MIVSYTDQHWNCFKGNTKETSKRRNEAHMGFPEYDVVTTLNRPELGSLMQGAHYDKKGGVVYFLVT